MEVGRWLLLGLAIEDPWLEVTTSIMGRAGWTVHGQFVRRLIKRFFHFKIFFSKIDIFDVFCANYLRRLTLKTEHARTEEKYHRRETPGADLKYILGYQHPRAAKGTVR
jgi:hypothetical protein